MEEATKRRVEETVLHILKASNMETTTEYSVRMAASERLGLDLSLPEWKRFVRSVVESFLASPNEDDDDDQQRQGQQDTVSRGGDDQQQEEEDKEVEEEEEEEEKVSGGKEYDDAGDLILCRLSNKRRVTLQEFRGKTLVSIREFYEKDGKQLPTSKGISLTAEQWEAFRKAVPAIKDAIRKLEEGD